MCFNCSDVTCTEVQSKGSSGRERKVKLNWIFIFYNLISNLQGNVSHNIARVRVPLSLSIKPRKLSIPTGTINCNTKTGVNINTVGVLLKLFILEVKLCLCELILERCVPAVCFDTPN